MKTAKEVDKEINELIRSINKDLKENEVKSIKREVAFLRQCYRYLETCPRQEFIKSQLEEVQRRIDLIPSHFEAWKTGKVLTKYKDPYSAYQNEMRLPDLKAQVKTLTYLLN
jgi:predicted translin family RNA/ssDNA-binding protein